MLFRQTKIMFPILAGVSISILTEGGNMHRPPSSNMYTLIIDENSGIDTYFIATNVVVTFAPSVEARILTSCPELFLNLKS